MMLTVGIASGCSPAHRPAPGSTEPVTLPALPAVPASEPQPYVWGSPPPADGKTTQVAPTEARSVPSEDLPTRRAEAEVQLGDQAALRSRKHPFAKYIAQIHRKIHEAWAWGFLDQLDLRAATHPFNDLDLWTRVEIVLNSDGTIHNVITVRVSGEVGFDEAAREVVFAAGPFPNPPAEIRSPSGKIYMHWALHRDSRACGTFGADPFILLDESTGGGSRAEPTRPVMLRKGPSPTQPTDSEVMMNDVAAQKLANEWLSYVHREALEPVMARSAVPFGFRGEVVAETRTELRAWLRTMVEQNAGAKPKKPKLFTAVGLRRVMGSMPAGVIEGEARVYGLTKIGEEHLILILEKKVRGYKVVGVAR